MIFKSFRHRAGFNAFLVPIALLALLLSAGPARAADTDRAFGDNVALRDGVNNARIHFEKEKKGTVAFIGGSITEMNGYRPMVCELLKERFPATEFTFIDAGISSTCSTTGAFRVQNDVLDHGPVDLFFVEFAVNDDQDAGHTREECIRGMEGIVRHCRRANPNMDIVFTYFVNEGMLKTFAEGKTPLTVEAHDVVAAHYGVPSINLAREASQEILAKKLTWKQYGGVHPAPYGNALCTRMIEQLLDRSWDKPLTPDAKMQAHAPVEPLDSLNYERGRFIDPKEAQDLHGWSLAIPDWKALPGGKRDRFTAIPMLCATGRGASAALKFEGTAVGAYVVAGPDAGIVESSIDDGPFQPIDLFHRFSRGLHYPRTVMFATDLKPGSHTVVIRMSENSTSGGHAGRIMEFVAN